MDKFTIFISKDGEVGLSNQDLIAILLYSNKKRNSIANSLFRMSQSIRMGKKNV